MKYETRTHHQNDQIYWQFRMAGIFVEKDGRKLHTACPNGCEVVMDTGTSLITGPSHEIDAINTLLGAKKDDNTNHYMMDCVDESDVDSFPLV